MGSGGVQVRFHLTSAEYQRATLRVCMSLWLYRGFIVVTALVFMAGIGFAQNGATGPGLSLIGVAIVWSLAIGWAFFIRPALRFRREPRLGGEQFLSFAEDEIKARDAHAESRIKWSMYDRVIETGDLYLLHITRMLATVLPKRAFASPGDEARFRELVRRHVKSNLR